MRTWGRWWIKWNWMAFQDQPQATSGSLAFGGMWTTETKCDILTFKQARRHWFLTQERLIDCLEIVFLCYPNEDMWIFQNFAATPFVFLSAKYTRTTKPNDAVYVWLENVSSGGFEVCIREFSPFDGKHQDTVVVCIILPSEYHHRHHHLYDNNHHHYCHYYSYPSPPLSSLHHHHIRVTDNQHYHHQHFQYPFNIIIFVTILIVVFIILMYFLLLWKGLFCFSITKEQVTEV